jgi:dCMP deaminase
VQPLPASSVEPFGPRQANERPSWDEYFLEITRVVAKRSTCLRRAVGAIFVKDKQIIATGYNGVPKSLRHCSEVGCMREALGVPSGQRHEICRGLHAEQNAIIQAAVHGVPIQGATLYCTTQPCVICSKMLINAGIRAIKYVGAYPDELSLAMLNEAGIALERLDPPPVAPNS